MSGRGFKSWLWLWLLLAGAPGGHSSGLQFSCLQCRIINNRAKYLTTVFGISYAIKVGICNIFDLKSVCHIKCLIKIHTVPS